MDVIIKEEPGSDARRAVKRKRIRRLVDLDIPEERRKRFRGNAESEDPKKRCSKRVIITYVLISISILMLLGHMESEFGIFTRFFNSYQEHYHQIVHGNRNYCKDELDVADLFAKIRNEQTILHQEKALRQIELVLETSLAHERHINIALVGPVGVGKTLFIHSLLNHFPWPENVYSYIWNTFEHTEMQKYRNVRVSIDHFSDCGINLLIVKNLTPADKKVANDVIDMIETQWSGGRRKRVIVFFVFYLNTMLSENEYLEQRDSLLNLNHTRTVNFRSFSKKELADCIRLELELENMTVSEHTFYELMNTIDVHRSGCKNVHAKIMAFGKKLSGPSVKVREEI